jgi:hypothetical protein
MYLCCFIIDLCSIKPARTRVSPRLNTKLLKYIITGFDLFVIITYNPIAALLFHFDPRLHLVVKLQSHCVMGFTLCLDFLLTLCVVFHRTMAYSGRNALSPNYMCIINSFSYDRVFHRTMELICLSSPCTCVLFFTDLQGFQAAGKSIKKFNYYY